jgi:RNA ligase (TIGR02306 family)
MSTLIVKVCQIEKIYPHLGADRLEIAIIQGWQIIIPKGAYKEGDAVVYIPIDSVLPHELSDRIGVTQYLSEGRVRCAKLRGEPSFGVIMTPDDPTWPIGMDVADILGVTKYEYPVCATEADADTPHPLLQRYTDIENIRNFPDVLHDGEEVYLSEKLHGYNCAIALIDGEEMASSHDLRRKRPDEEHMASNTYWYPWTIPAVQSLMHSLVFSHAQQVIMYGEVYGAGIKRLHYDALQHPKFRAFDILVNGKYLDHATFRKVCLMYGVDMVPELAVMPFNKADVQRFVRGNTTLGGGEHVREGIVIKPTVERTDPRVGRVVLKWINDDYLFKREAGDIDDSTDV